MSAANDEYLMVEIMRLGRNGRFPASRWESCCGALGRFFRLLVLVALVGGCGYRDAKTIHLSSDGCAVDLGAQLPGNWSRVCLFMPYVSTSQAGELLGFFYMPSWHSLISVMDDRVLLVTSAGGEVVGSHEVFGANINLTGLGSGCFDRKNSVVTHCKEK